MKMDLENNESECHKMPDCEDSHLTPGPSLHNALQTNDLEMDEPETSLTKRDENLNVETDLETVNDTHLSVSEIKSDNEEVRISNTPIVKEVTVKGTCTTAEVEVEKNLEEQISTDNQNLEVEQISTDNQSDEISQETTARTDVDKTLNYSIQDYKFENYCEITGVWKEFSEKEEICMRGCKWSPDGTCILTNSDDNVLRVFDLPPELHCQESWQRDRKLPELEPALRVREGGLIYDYCWYPLMSSWNPLSCCLVSTSKDSPVHLWDAFSGELRCTYRAYNAVDEIEAAHSVTFNPSGEKLYCGFKNFIRVFNTNVPGRHCETRNLKKTSYPGQRQTGIVSCISVNPAMPNIYVVGSYTRSIGVYSEPKGSLLCLLLGHTGGITHLQFSPDGTKLLSGGRKDQEMICWDIRNPGAILFTVQREVGTNQRMYFDMTPDSRYVVSGNTSGRVSVWDMQKVSESSSEEPVLSPSVTFTGHGDCINGISIHQQYPILATASGQRHFTHSESDTDSASDSGVFDTGLKLWWVGNIASDS